MPLTKAYISDRHLRIHTDESFAKAIQEAALEAAAESVGEQGSEMVTIDDVSIEVAPAEFTTMAGVDACLQVCVKIFGKRICRHVGAGLG